MDNFTKITTGWVKQYYEPNKDGTFVCTSQEFMAGDMVEYEDDFQEPVDAQIHQYQLYDMIRPGGIKEVSAAIDVGKDKIKRIEAKVVTPGNSPFEELRKNSAWLDAIFDVIDRTALAIRDELTKTGG